jgi:hypothetical protein
MGRCTIPQAGPTRPVSCLVIGDVARRGLAAAGQMPTACPRAIAACRVETPSLRKIARMWLLTVFRDSPSSAAISHRGHGPRSS